MIERKDDAIDRDDEQDGEKYNEGDDEKHKRMGEKDDAIVRDDEQDDMKHNKGDGENGGVERDGDEEKEMMDGTGTGVTNRLQGRRGCLLMSVDR
jgi:hypothetical protein